MRKFKNFQKILKILVQVCASPSLLEQQQVVMQCYYHYKDLLISQNTNIYWGNSFSTYVKFSAKVTFLTHCYAHISFLENFAYVLNE